MKKILAFFSFILAFSSASTQEIDSIQYDLLRINKVFDSSQYLGFDLTIKYQSDTSFGDFEYDELSGNYILSDSLVYYKMGDMEYIKSDSFEFNIYQGERLLIMSPRNDISKSHLFPIKQYLDSVLSWYQSKYDIAIDFIDSGEIKSMQFESIDSSNPYQKLEIHYDGESYRPARIEMHFTELEPGIEPEQVVSRNKVITIEFTNYKYVTILDVFNANNYVLYDHVTNRYRLTPKYKGYRFISNGVGDISIDETIETIDVDND